MLNKVFRSFHQVFNNSNNSILIIVSHVIISNLMYFDVIFLYALFNLFFIHLYLLFFQLNPVLKSQGFLY